MMLLPNFPKPSSLIIGYGVTGKATAFALGIRDHVDLGDSVNLKDYKNFIFCLPTPTVKGKQDLSAIEEWLKKIKKENKKALIILRSTVLPGTTDKLIKKYKLNIVHVPEFLTEATALEDAIKPEFLVIGTKSLFLRRKVSRLFNIEAKEKIFTDPTTAEFIKYTMNSFFSLKVIFGNQMWDVAQKVGANYRAVRAALEIHKWGSKNGWDVWHKGKRGAGGRCLPKDLDAFTNAFDIPLLSKVKEINDKLLKKK